VRATCRKIAVFSLMLLGLGCRTPKPNLKPATTAEALNAPPAERRFNVPNYPKEAFLDRNTIKKIDDDPITPVRGPGMQGMGGAH
jgi:hypothetical protein